MMKHTLLVSAATAAIAAIAGATLAQTAAPPVQPPPVRTILQQTDVASTPAQETMMGTVVTAPGSGNAPHTHNGSEMGYVVKGRIRMEIQGQPPRELGPGDSFLAPRGVVHRAVLVGTETVTLVSTWTVDKGKPLLVPAPAP